MICLCTHLSPPTSVLSCLENMWAFLHVVLHVLATNYTDSILLCVAKKQNLHIAIVFTASSSQSHATMVVLPSCTLRPA